MRISIQILGLVISLLISTIAGDNDFFDNPLKALYEPWTDSSAESKRWIQIPQSRKVEDEVEEGRHLRPETFYRISETLGALNTVGRYIVNMTRGVDTDSPLSEEIPSAIYTLSKNVLGRNVTDTIAPFVREALPNVIPPQPAPALKTTTEATTSGSRGCTTPDGLTGFCEDLSDCPQLLLDLTNLRQSLCFKSLFVPGVCCPKRAGDAVATSTIVPAFHTQTTPRTVAPVIIATTKLPLVTARPDFEIVGNIVDPNDCGQPENAKFRVVGGEEALPGRWPWMAAIFLHGSRRTEFWCGGTLVSIKHVLTAAHCTKDSRQRSFASHQFTVRLGDIDLKREDEPSGPVTYKVKEIRAHADFSRVGYYNDIALLVLDRPVRKSRYVIPLCLPSSALKSENFAGRRTTVVGWGTTYYGGKESTVQRQAVLPVWRNEDCNQAYFQPITKNFICAGYSEGGVDACQGDSGGPLMIHWDTRWVQVGVVSFGNKCGEPGYPGVYTRITEYLDWLKDNINHSS